MPNAELVFDARAELAEGPVWLEATQELLWVDIEGQRVHWLDTRSGRDRSLDLGAHVGAAIPDRSGGVILALPSGLARLAAGDELPVPLVGLSDDPAMRLNDAACDRRGRIFVGSVPITEDVPTGSLYRIDADLHVERVLDGLTISNGIDWTPDDTRMFFIDTVTNRVDQLDYDLERGAATGRRPFCAIDEGDAGPDGMCVDAEGGLWVALWGGSAVLGLTPEGELHTRIELPVSLVTSVAFGGPDLRTLYITTAAYELGGREPHAGGIFTADVGVAGALTTPFAG